MNKTEIKDVESFNHGVQEALNVLRQHFFAGNMAGGESAIVQIEKMVIPTNEKDVFVETEIPDSMPDTLVEATDILVLSHG
jgi:hypothetical protein